jgi:hypothetical protein
MCRVDTYLTASLRRVDGFPILKLLRKLRPISEQDQHLLTLCRWFPRSRGMRHCLPRRLVLYADPPTHSMMHWEGEVRDHIMGSDIIFKALISLI